MNNDPATSQTTVAKAAKLLRSRGWTCIEPTPTPRYYPMLDQCEYPDRRGAPGDCCINSTRRSRKTKFGTMWLCSDHFAAPLSELFDERLNADGQS